MNEEKETLKQLDYYLNHWHLTTDGDSFFTATSLLQPCIHQGRKAMLKLLLEEEERRGGMLMQWWDKTGVAIIFACDNNALLMERIENTKGLNLINLVEQGLDDQATQIICNTTELLHRPKEQTTPQLITLEQWFSSFVNTNHFANVSLAQCARHANVLLENQKEQCVLHGDLHHQNILYSDTRGWLAIDPKGLYGDRAFDFANILCNPDAKHALAEGRLAHQIEIISNQTKIECDRLIDWVIAWSGLSAFWMEEEGKDSYLPTQIAKLALSEREKYK